MIGVLIAPGRKEMGVPDDGKGAGVRVEGEREPEIGRGRPTEGRIVEMKHYSLQDRWICKKDGSVDTKTA